MTALLSYYRRGIDECSTCRTRMSARNIVRSTLLNCRKDLEVGEKTKKEFEKPYLNAEMQGQ